MILYMWQNKVSNRIYYGITKNSNKRNACHRHTVKNGTKTPFYDSVRSYGWENFQYTILSIGSDEHIANLEELCIAHDTSCYNLHKGGHIGFDITTSPKVTEWKQKLSNARKGKKPALGMKHSDETKKLCGTYAKARWDKEGRYSKEVLEYGFTEANKKFGISKTHYYRLRKAVME
jgi:group I intron endonuclease